MSTDTKTRKSGKHWERHIINGSANLNYTYEQFASLSVEHRQEWIRFASIQAKMDSPHPDAIKGAMPGLFEAIKTAAKTAQMRTGSLMIGNTLVKSAAQAMTAIGYDRPREIIPFCSLDFKVKCNDFADLQKCCSIIESYNEFHSGKLYGTAAQYLGARRWYNNNNPNNGNDLFTFHIGRESSPVFYVCFNSYSGANIITKQDGAEYEWEEFTGDDFKKYMYSAQGSLRADEFSIEEKQFHPEGTYYTARFWWD